MDLKPLERITFEAGTLIREHPPRWDHPNKRLVFEIASSSGFPFEGQVTYSRWPQLELPSKVDSRPPFSVFRAHFSYVASAEPATVDWHLNFSDPYLFVAYDSPLLAQDEHQVAEHPILGSVRDALLSRGMKALTVDERGRPTPVTITGAQRRCVVDTRPNPEAGYPSGLYGNAFARATPAQVRAATTPLSPPTLSNILAMAAPDGGYGEYSRDEMVHILSTAYTGFAAAREESERMVPEVVRIVIHTGFWGCGAFGGNRRLMTVLQALAADLAGVETAFWAFDESGLNTAKDGRQWYERVREGNPSISALLDRLVEEKFQWGVSDGN